MLQRTSDGSHYEKRGKGKPVCIDDEIPFEIPKSWGWARVGSITNLINGKAFKPSDWTEDGLPIVRIQNLNTPTSTFNRYNGEVPEVFHLHGGELLFAWSGTPGTSFGAHVWKGREALLNQHIFKVEFSEENISKAYFKLVLNQRVLVLIGQAHGSAGLQHVTRGVFESTLVPIPPLSEQKEIASRLIVLAPLVDHYNTLETARERLDTELPSRLRKSIFQMAVQGKLVPQDPSDEPASALLERIRSERVKLVKKKKIKASKGGDSVIYRASDGGYYEKRGKGEPQPIEVPFDVPDTWEWVRVSSVFNLVRGSGIKRTEITMSGEPCVRYGELYTTYQTEISKVVSHTTREVFDGAQKLLNREVVVTLTGENDIDIGRSVVNNTGKIIAFGGDLLALKGNYIDGEFAMLCINSPYMELQRTAAASGNIIVHLSASKIGDFLMALPPTDEQKRIVARCKELLATIG